MQNSTDFSLFDDIQKCFITNAIIRYFSTLIFIIGIISTLLSICVFARKPLRRKSCCFYFLILAISDSIHLLTMFIEYLPYSYHIDLITIHTSICKITIFLIYFTNHLSNLVLTLASVDRFILIYCPSRSKLYCNIHKAKCLVCITMIILFLSNGHILYGYEKILLNTKQSNETYDCYIRQENVFYNNLFYFYDSYIEGLFFVLIPFFIMIICSLLIIFQIFQTRKTIRYNPKGKFYYYTFRTSETIRETVRKTLREQAIKTRLRDKDIQLCSMLIGTTLAFLFLCLPTEINDLFSYTGRERSCSNWFRKVMLMLMQQIYYAGHLYIYTLTGQLFRKHLYAFLFGQNHQSFKQRILTNFNSQQRSKSSFTTTSFINTTVHRPMITTQSQSNDPSQRLLSDSKYLIDSY